MDDPLFEQELKEFKTYVNSISEEFNDRLVKELTNSYNIGFNQGFRDGLKNCAQWTIEYINSGRKDKEPLTIEEIKCFLTGYLCIMKLTEGDKNE